MDTNYLFNWEAGRSSLLYVVHWDTVAVRGYMTMKLTNTHFTIDGSSLANFTMISIKMFTFILIYTFIVAVFDVKGLPNSDVDRLNYIRPYIRPTIRPLGLQQLFFV